MWQNYVSIYDRKLHVTPYFINKYLICNLSTLQNILPTLNIRFLHWVYTLLNFVKYKIVVDFSSYLSGKAVYEKCSFHFVPCQVLCPLVLKACCTILMVCAPISLKESQSNESGEVLSVAMVEVGSECNRGADLQFWGRYVADNVVVMATRLLMVPPLIERETSGIENIRWNFDFYWKECYLIQWFENNVVSKFELNVVGKKCYEESEFNHPVWYTLKGFLNRFLL